MRFQYKLVIIFWVTLSTYAFGYNPDVAMYNNYEGLIDNKYKITLSILPMKNGTLTGDYVYDKIGKKIKLSGNWNDQHIQINELNKNSISATFISSDFNDNSGVIVGYWHNLKSNSKLAFKLRHISSTSAINKKRYSSTLSDEQIESFANDIKSAVIHRDYNWLSNNLRYPIQIKSLDIHIKNKVEFINNAKLIITNELISNLKSARTFFLFCNSDGISLSNGEIWFSEIEGNEQKLKILKIGSATPVW
ncbi:hypothetical protein [Zooshikella sp. RANM57]|uniref:hypothetical protein n=1 Tax=Zooshikella sp. RANM57 TaxID=3425863 RepID=UPI003D6DE7FD